MSVRVFSILLCTITVHTLLGSIVVKAQDNAFPESKSSTTLALVGGRVIDGFGGKPLENTVVLISENSIAAVGKISEIGIPKTAKIIDTNGMTVLPGLWDSHGHLFHIGEGTPTDFPNRYKDRSIELMAIVAEINLMAGITSFRDTGGPLKPQLTLREEIKTGNRIGPRLFLAGPILRQGDRNKSINNDDYLIANTKEAKKMVTEVANQGADQIKVYGFWDLDILSEVTSTAHSLNLGVDADVRHIEAYRTAIRAGVDRLHHVFTADSLSDYSEDDLRLLVRGEKPSGSGPSANILRGPYIIPTIEMRASYARAFRFPEIIDHPNFKRAYPPDIYKYFRDSLNNINSIPWGIGAEERVKVAKNKLKRFVAKGGREQLVAGCDSGSPLNFHSPLAREIQHLSEAGLTPMEAIQSATLRAAQMQGVSDKLGSISVGKIADIIVVDGDPLTDISLLRTNVAHVIKDGVIIR